jgi:hypothetical protein
MFLIILFSAAASAEMWQTCRQVGHFLKLSRSEFTRQTLQKECPQAVVSGSHIIDRQREHSSMLEKDFLVSSPMP